MRRLWMILLVLVIPLTASGLVQFIPPGGGGSGGGGGGAQAPSFTVATRPTGVPVGTVIAVIDGTNAQDCAVGGGTSVVQCRWNGSAWLAFGDGSTAGSGGAPDNAPYVTLAPAAGLLAEQPLSVLASGLLLNTTGTGVPTIYPGSGAVANQFMRSVTASGVASFGGVAETDLLFAVATQAELDAVQGATAPLTAPFVTTLPVAGLPAEQALSTLTTGLLRNTTGTGVPTIYPGTTCPNGFPRSLNAEGGADCQSVAEADLLYAAATQPELDAVQVGLQGQIDLVAAAQLGYYVKTLQTLAQDASIDCTPPTGQFIGAIARVMATAAEVTLGVPQIVAGQATNQFCLLLGEDDVFPVNVFDGAGVQLAQADHSVVLGPRDAMLLQWTGTTWRQVDQFGVASGGSSEAQGLQANCEVDCELGPLSEEQPLIWAPADNRSTPEIEGPQEHLFSPDGNFARVRYSSPGVLAGPEPTTMEPDTCWSVQAKLGPPLTLLPVGSLCNVGGVNVSRQGIFEIPDASAIEFQPVPNLTATNVQSALNELAGQVSGLAESVQVMTAGGFNDLVFSLPSQTYGMARETCESPQAGDITLSTTDAWQTALQAGVPGDRFFLNAGTYTIAGSLNLPDGTAAEPIQIKPNNCAAVILDGRTRPCSYNILAGLTLRHLGTGGVSAAVEFNRTTPMSCTGTIVRNNLIHANNVATINFANNFAANNILIKGNDIRRDAGTANVSFRMDSAVASVTVEDNKFSSGTQPNTDDVIGSSGAANWGGAWLFQHNWFAANPTENMVDIKAPGVAGGTMTFRENYFNGINLVGGCVLIQADLPDLPYTFVFERNFMTECQPGIKLHIATGETAPSYDEVTSLIRQNIFVSPLQSDRVIETDRGNTTIEHNTFISGSIEIGTTANLDPSNLFIRNNIFSGVFFEFELSNSMDECTNNLFHNATGQVPTCQKSLAGDPLFVNISNDWHLQPASPARGQSSAGLNIGAYMGGSGSSGVSLPPWHLPWQAAGALVDGTTCVTQAKALINAGPSVVSVVCADAATGTIEFSFDTPERYVGGAMTICTEVNDPTAAGSVWAAAIIAQFRASGQVVTNTWSTPVVASATLTTAHAGYFACAAVTPNGAAAGIGRVFIKATMDSAGLHNDVNGRVLGGYVSGP